MGPSEGSMESREPAGLEGDATLLTETPKLVERKVMGPVVPLTGPGAQTMGMLWSVWGKLTAGTPATMTLEMSEPEPRLVPRRTMVLRPAAGPLSGVPEDGLVTGLYRYLSPEVVTP